MSEKCLLLVKQRLLDELGYLALVLEDPFLQVFVLVFGVRGEVAHDELLLELLIEPRVDHGLAAAYVDLSEVFEVLDQLILKVGRDVLRFWVLRKLPKGSVNPLEDALLKIDVKFVDLVGLIKSPRVSSRRTLKLTIFASLKEMSPGNLSTSSLVNFLDLKAFIISCSSIWP